MREFIAQYRGSERFTDQFFLKTALWPTVRESVLNHDELFHFHQAQPWPAHPPVRWQMPRFHVGSNVGFASLTGPSHAANGARQQIEISGDGKSWHYPAQVKNGQWLLPMPYFLIEEWQAGKLSVTVR